MWPDAYYLTYNIFANAQSFSTSRVCAMDRTKMIAGDATATTQCFDTGPNFFGLLVADLDGKTPPAAGSPAHIITLDSSTDLAYWQLHVDFTTPANSTLSATPQTDHRHGLHAVLQRRPGLRPGQGRRARSTPLPTVR